MCAFARRNFEKMTKIIMLFWVLSPKGDIVAHEIGDWYTMERCNAAAVSLTEPNPADGWSPLIAVRCMEVPK